MSTPAEGLPLGFAPRTALAVNEAAVLASERDGRALGARELARRTAAPLGEVCAVAGLLKEAGLVEANGRADGSFRWSRDPSLVSLYEIASAVGESFDVLCSPEANGGGNGLCRGCPMARLVSSLRSEVIGLFKAKKLDELIAASA